MFRFVLITKTPKLQVRLSRNYHFPHSPVCRKRCELCCISAPARLVSLCLWLALYHSVPSPIPCRSDPSRVLLSPPYHNLFLLSTSVMCFTSNTGPVPLSFRPPGVTLNLPSLKYVPLCLVLPLCPSILPMPALYPFPPAPTYGPLTPLDRGKRDRWGQGHRMGRGIQRGQRDTRPIWVRVAQGLAGYRAGTEGHMTRLRPMGRESGQRHTKPLGVLRI